MKNKIAAAILLTVALAVTGCGSGGSDATENTTASQEGINSLIVIQDSIPAILDKCKS